MDRRRLQCFVALAEELHFGRAALRCHISQPGLSQQLRHLEEQLQAQLFYRNKRHVSLTRAGEVFLVEVRKILRSMEIAVDVTRQTDCGVIGQLTVGTTASALFIALPEILNRLRAAVPHAHVTVREMSTAEQEDALRNGDIHAGLVLPPLDDESLVCQELATIPFDVVVSAENPLSESTALRMKDLANERFIMFPRDVGPRLYDQIIALCQQEGFSPAAIVEAAPAQSIVAMAACNLGVGFVASRVQHYDRNLAVFKKLEEPAPYLSLGVAYTEECSLPLVRQFVRTAINVGRHLE